MMSSEKGNANSGGPSSSAVGDSSDGEEPEDSSSNSDMNPEVLDILENFRQQWQLELQITPKQNTGTLNKQREERSELNAEDIENQAKALFLRGTELERTGKLYEAIQFYKRAVQLVPDIEFRLYESLKSLKPRMEQKTITSHDGYDETLMLTEDLESEDEDGDLSNSIGNLLYRLQRKIGKNPCICMPKHEQRNTHISSLPMEIIFYILRWVVSSDLDVRSLELCSRVCRGFYVYCRDTEIWRLVCAKAWGANCGPKPDPYSSWRDMYLERPRLLFNGCYISKTTYIRHGENSFQDQFYRPWHLVEYYRYIRFFSEGKVLMLTSPDEPAQCVGHLRYRNPRNTGVLLGHYRIRDDLVTLLVQRQEINTLPMNYRRKRKETPPEHADQNFHLELKIADQHKRKHVQLVWSRYSVFTRNRNGTESTSTFDLAAGTRFPPLWFSRVKSYTLESESPLQ